MDNFSSDLITCLKLFGKGESDIKGYKNYTRLYHDLGIYGDEAYEFISILETSFGVDLSSFVFESYFPMEFPGDTQLQRVFYWVFPCFIKKKEKTTNL
ncbi:hypothetical protein KY46_14800 [Photobacterium halotolerans]|uniref:Uncharacterized protein n=1 Tax=Photobacterium halotolerans TaxID=265726 RepID=A0A0F5VAC2_9GAMM|nr:hypothetical protein KY46_14800 [Photobacterium halotolerans]